MNNKRFSIFRTFEELVSCFELDKEITAISFDEKANLIWSGDIIAFHMIQLLLYTRYRAYMEE